MGFRFRRSAKLLPGVRLNLGKRGASVSVGVRGAHVTYGPTGTRTTVGIPGTGLSYTSTASGHHRTPQETAGAPSQRSRLLRWVGFALLFLALAMLMAGFLAR
ncbi:MAG: hypothetical protein JWN63_241 [Candidatus Acidoferrum typicum]|nr:hypothetical protein [Candidatus Acidoferrum typicum]